MKLILMLKIKEDIIKYFEEKLKENNYDLEKNDFNICLIVNELKRSLEINFSYIKKKKLNFYSNILNNIQKTISKEYNEIIKSVFEERKTFFSKFDKYYYFKENSFDL